MRSTFILGLVTVLLAAPSNALAQVPVYTAQYAGPGQSVAMNNHGVVIGNPSTVYPGQPWVNPGAGPVSLPLPPGIPGARVSAINDAGTIVGTVYTDGQLLTDLPAMWTPNGAGGYDVALLPLAGRATRATGVAVNNLGQVLVSGFGIDGVLPTYRAYVVDGGNVVPLGLANPITINDNGIVLTNSTLFDYATMTDLGLPAPPTGITVVGMYPSDLNNDNQMAVTLLSTIIGSTRYESIAVYTIGVGWNLITGIVTNTSSGRINDNGDILVNTGSCGTMVYLNGLGFYCPGSLLDPGDTAWTLGRALDINNTRDLLAYGSNAVSGDVGAVRMTRVGNLPAP
ncbi:MAG: hypothetical protein OEW19_09520, partial [Acidobacteriota bacterium]|nr:hypothetical protein [Acidobacteriota bacterium]